MGRPRYHVLFWIVLFGTALAYDTLVKNQGVLSWSGYIKEFNQLDTWFQIGRVILTVYGSQWLFTRFAFPHQPALVLGQIVLLGVLDASLMYGLQRYVVLPLNPVPDPEPISDLTARLPFSWLFVMIGFVFKQLRDYQRNEELQREKNRMELAYLKAQLNPHFLFNTMNNLYGLALTEPESTPDAILKLSELMRYMLHESNADRVSLEREVAYLSSYIALEELRHEERVFINFTVEGNLAGLQIAPLLLIGLVENALKHGQLGNVAQPVQLQLTIREGRIRFTTFNEIMINHKSPASGMGLPTLRRRLALLYPHTHRLCITASAHSFQCTLELDT